MSSCGVARESGAALPIIALREDLTRCGFGVIRNFLRPTLAMALARSFTSLQQGLPVADLLGGGRREWLPPFEAPWTNFELVQHPLLTELCRMYLGDDVRLDALTVTTAPFGASAQAMHRDIVEGPAAALTIQVPLVDLPISGGGLAIQPTSHALSFVECDEADATVQSAMRAGDAMAYDPRLCHRGTANMQVMGSRPVIYLLFKSASAQLTGYAPFELNLRFGSPGLETVLDYRWAFDEHHRGACFYGNCTRPRMRAAHNELPFAPLARVSPYL